ncbi:hypothetical protein FA13DRAFT_1741883 [Coprinellus micaceus]|uniref:DUF6534 domain-containing protein n=1 Tax=Coprinellus micaceus TaxID=71717 RepID=A0A4Y7SIK3_COPMI|nr:hypothetical protein FA13DRAFT_1741883 [Coprinellus micaceus]
MAIAPTVDNTWGAAFIGLLLAAILYGITFVQTYIYFSTYPEDGLEFKFMAGAAFALDSTSLALLTSAMYQYLITDMNSPFDRLFVNRAFDIEPCLMGLLAFLAHLYLGMRVWKVCNRKIWLGALLSVLMVLTLALAFASTIVSWKHRTWLELKVAMKPLALSGIITTILLDAIIAIVLCAFLFKHRDVEGRHTRKLVKKVGLYAINTGLVSSVLSVCNLAMFLAYPDTMVFLSLTMIYTKVYANALLGNLNAREHLRCTVRSGSDCNTLSLNLSALRTTSARYLSHFRLTTVQSETQVYPTQEPVQVNICLSQYSDGKMRPVEPGVKESNPDVKGDDAAKRIPTMTP